MNKNHLIGFGTAAALLILAISAYLMLFEIYPSSKYIAPSRDAISNEYLALDRWLIKSGIPVRIENSPLLDSFINAEEMQIFMQASLFQWSSETVNIYKRWIYEGGHLFLAMDTNDAIPYIFLGDFGIVIPEASRDESLGSDSANMGENFPDYDHRVSFKVHDDEAHILKDFRALTRLVQVKHGKGTLTVTGRPFFIYSRNLNKAPNAVLAWTLFIRDYVPAMTGEKNSGWLFFRRNTRGIQASPAPGILGSMFREGNLPVLLVSLAVFMIIGFWAVIPVFGVIQSEKERPGKPLRERFLAEGRFLKKYKALFYYREIYLNEIKRLLSRKEGIIQHAELQDRIISFYKKISLESTSSEEYSYNIDLLKRNLEGNNLNYMDFPGLIKILKTILERL